MRVGGVLLAVLVWTVLRTAGPGPLPAEGPAAVPAAVPFALVAQGVAHSPSAQRPQEPYVRIVGLTPGHVVLEAAAGWEGSGSYRLAPARLVRDGRRLVIHLVRQGSGMTTDMGIPYVQFQVAKRDLPDYRGLELVPANEAGADLRVAMTQADAEAAAAAAAAAGGLAGARVSGQPALLGDKWGQLPRFTWFVNLFSESPGPPYPAAATGLAQVRIDAHSGQVERLDLEYRVDGLTVRRITGEPGPDGALVITVAERLGRDGAIQLSRRLLGAVGRIPADVREVQVAPEGAHGFLVRWIGSDGSAVAVRVDEYGNAWLPGP